MRARSLVALSLLATFGLLTAVALAGAPLAGADEGTTGTTTETTDTTVEPPPTEAPAPPPPPAPKPKAKPGPRVIAAGVKVGSVLVGGLTASEATDLLRARFRQPIVVVVSPARRYRVVPTELGASAQLTKAVRRARSARAGARLTLDVAVARQRLERWTHARARELRRDPVDSRIVLRGTKPVATRSVDGRRLLELATVRALYRALKTGDREPVALPFRELEPKLSETSFPPVVVIRRESKRLDFYVHLKLKRTFRVATGQSSFPTPLGSYEVTTKWRNPWWYPPPSGWAKDAEPVPPGPGNPLGTRWMGISAPYVGIHGTPDSSSIGYSASHGCIRMLIPDAEWLYERIEVGSPVFILPR